MSKVCAIDRVRDDHAPGGHAARGHALRERDQVGRDIVALKREPASGATEAGHHLVHPQPDAAAVAEDPHPRRIPPRWNEDPSAAGDRLEQNGMRRQSPVATTAASVLPW